MQLVRVGELYINLGLNLQPFQFLGETMRKLLLLVFVASGLGVAQTCEDGFRLFDHELLVTKPVCIPENPERVLDSTQSFYGLFSLFTYTHPS